MVEYENMKLTLPHEHINMCNSSLWILIGNWQKNSCTTKTVRKMRLESDKKGREPMKLGPVPLGGDSEEKTNTHPGEWIAWATYWAPQPWGPTSGIQVPIADLKATGTYRMAVRNRDSDCEEHTCARVCARARARLLPGTRLRKKTENCLGRWPVSCDSPSTHPSPLSACFSPSCSRATLH